MRWNGASRCEFDGKSIETETTTWSEFPNGGKAIVEQILASEEINKSKKAKESTFLKKKIGCRVLDIKFWTLKEHALDFG